MITHCLKFLYFYPIPSNLIVQEHSPISQAPRQGFKINYDINCCSYIIVFLKRVHPELSLFPFPYRSYNSNLFSPKLFLCINMHVALFHLSSFTINTGSFIYFKTITLPVVVFTSSSSSNTCTLFGLRSRLLDLAAYS